MASSTDITIMKMVTDVIIAHVSNNKVDATLLPQLTTDLFSSYKSMENLSDNIQKSTDDDVSLRDEDTRKPFTISDKSIVQNEEAESPKVVGFVNGSAAEAEDEADDSYGDEEEDLDEVESQEPPPEPAVPINQSVHHDHLICLEDGKSVVMLTRYLRTHHNLTFEEYKEKWDLPDNYPKVAPSFSEKKSQMAKLIGLGKANNGHLRGGRKKRAGA